MIKVGKRQKLVINNFASVGAYLFAVSVFNIL